MYKWIKNIGDVEINNIFDRNVSIDMILRDGITYETYTAMYLRFKHMGTYDDIMYYRIHGSKAHIVFED